MCSGGPTKWTRLTGQMATLDANMKGLDTRLTCQMATLETRLTDKVNNTAWQTKLIVAAMLVTQSALGPAGVVSQLIDRFLGK